MRTYTTAAIIYILRLNEYRGCFFSHLNPNAKNVVEHFVLDIWGTLLCKATGGEVDIIPSEQRATEHKRTAVA